MPDPARPEDVHEEAEALLPWYATGQLSPTDRALVENHLSSCARCQRQLGIERQVIDEFQAFAPQLDAGWARLRSRIERGEPVPSWRARTAADFWNLFRRPAVASLAAAQVAFLILAAVLLSWLNHPDYQVLGGSEPPPVANVIVMFAPATTEAELRRALNASGASLVGGPTAADAYLLHVPANERSTALSRLRADAQVTMAQPIDGIAQ